MTPEQPPAVTPGAPSGAGSVDGKQPDKTSWSMSSRAVHADDGISAHRAVAPAMHVSTTFRYDDDPDKLSSLGNIDVSLDIPLCLKEFQPTDM